MTQDDDWSDLSKAWTAPAPDTDMRTMADVKRRDALSRLNFAFEMLVNAAAAVFLVWAVAKGVMAWLPAVATFGFIAFAIIMTLWSRRRAPDLEIDTPLSALRTAAAQARSGQRWAWAGLAICAAGAIYLAVVMGSVSPIPQPVMMVGTAAAAFVLVWVGIYIAHARTCARRLDAYTKTLAALQDEGRPDLAQGLP